MPGTAALRLLLAIGATASLAGGCGNTARPSDPATAAVTPSAPKREPRLKGEGDELLGTPAPSWNASSWLNSPPLTLEGLRGRVVLLRWWTAPDCPLCSGTAPSLNALHARYKDDGLVVIGFYHHKSNAPLRLSDVADYASKFGFTFPVAVDPGWSTLRTYWLDGKERDYTSVSFLLDRRGIIRFIHPGGIYTPGSEAYEELRQAIEKAIAEPAGG